MRSEATSIIATLRSSLTSLSVLLSLLYLTLFVNRYEKKFRAAFLTRLGFPSNFFEEETAQLKYAVREIEKDSDPFNDHPWLKQFLVLLQNNQIQQASPSIKTPLADLTSNENEKIAMSWICHFEKCKNAEAVTR